MPENPNSYLPQSAAPLGQAPLAVIRPPQVNVNIPNPLDITNFYRMQQGIQNNLGILQQNQHLQQAERALDQRDYELMLRDTDSLIGSHNDTWDSFYGDTKSNRQSSNGSDPTGGLFGNLDPTYAAQNKIINKWHDEYQHLQDETYKLGAAYLSSGQKDPGQRLEVSRQISRLKDDFYRNISQDPEFRKQNEISQYYHTMLDQVDNLKQNGYAVDLEAVAKIDQKYKDYANGVTSVPGALPTPPNRNDFDITKYVYDPKTALTSIAADTKALQAGYEREELRTAVDGSQYSVKVMHVPDKAEIIKQLNEKYMNDRNAVGYYNNVLKGSTITDPNTGQSRPYTFEDFIGTNVSAFTPAGDRVTEIGNTVVKAPTKAKSATETGLGGPRPDGTWFDVSTDKGREYNTAAASIYATGYNVGTKDLYNVQQLIDDPQRYGIKYETKDVEDEDGNVLQIPQANIYAYNVDEHGKRTYTDGKPDLAQTDPVYTFTKRQEVIDTHKVPDALPTDDIGSTNNNPLNLRPTDQEKKSGVPLGEGGFRKFDTIEEGLAYANADIKSKVVGNSTAMQGSDYMKSKYTEDQLKNYQDVATIEDLINVWSPRKKYGGDNTDEEVDKYIQSIKDSGIDPNTKLKDLGDKEIQDLTMAMMKVESPGSYRRFNTPDATGAASTSSNDQSKGSGIDWTGPADTTRSSTQVPDQQSKPVTVNDLMPGSPAPFTPPPHPVDKMAGASPLAKMTVQNEKAETERLQKFAKDSTSTNFDFKNNYKEASPLARQAFKSDVEEAYAKGYMSLEQYVQILRKMGE